MWPAAPVLPDLVELCRSNDFTDMVGPARYCSPHHRMP